MRNAKPRTVASSMAGGVEKAEQFLAKPSENDSAFARIGRTLSRALYMAGPSIAARWHGTGRQDMESVSEMGELHRVPRWKRTLDLISVFITAPCWLIAMALVALWIKTVSRGPVFYFQPRIGLGGKRFTIFKFRSMRANVETRSHEEHLTNLIRENCPMRKLDATGDPRLIPGGRVLRALGLDELPQIINILRGDMSVVGPRPCTPHEFQHYQPWQKERVNALPGLTGVWQVSGKNKTTFDEMIRMDLFYTTHMSPWFDLQIIAKTVPSVLSQLTESWAAKVRANSSVNRRVSLEEPVAE